MHTSPPDDTAPDKLSNLTKGIRLRGRVYWLNFKRNGKRHFITLQTSDKMEAIRRAEEIRRSPMLAPASPFHATIDRYLATKRQLNEYSRATERVHGAALREFANGFTQLSIAQVTLKQAQQHYAALQKRVKETTAQIHIRALRAFFNWCISERMTRSNPFAELKTARIDNHARLLFCTKRQRDSLIESASTDDLRFILFCGFHAGMRKNEIIEARVRWFDLTGNGAVHIRNTTTFRVKDREARFIPLTLPFREFLQDYLSGKTDDDFALKPSVKHGKGTYRYDFHRPYNEHVTSQGMRWCTAHVMRHTFASLLVQDGVSIFKVARWLGDGVEVAEKHYAHLAPQDADIERLL